MHRVKTFRKLAESPNFAWRGQGKPQHFKPHEVVEHAIFVFSLPAAEPFAKPGPNPWLVDAVAAESKRNQDEFKIGKGGWICFEAETDTWGKLYSPPPSIKLCTEFSALYSQRDLDSVVSKTLEFAAKYGPLGYGAFIRVGEMEEQLYAEPLAYWISESLAMEKAITLHECIESGNSKKIRENLTTTIGSDSRSLELRRPSLDDGPATGPITGVAWTDIHTLTFAAALDEKSFRFLADPAKHDGQPLLLAKSELISELDRKLATNVEVRCFNLEGAIREVVPRNLIGHLYLTLSRSIKPTRRGSVRCNKCQATIANRQRRRTLNFCDAKCRKQFNRQHR